ncbi:MAG: hypothetical protein SH859_03835 [Hyphomicrobium aestuarii]|nr:hypothetical protein [Hyphomicrobium aestuarii]
MNRLMIAGIAAVALAGAAVGGWFYVQNRAKSEVETAFAGLRSSGTQASYRTVAFDLFSRTLNVSDIAISNPKGGSATIGEVTAAGIDLAAKNFSARTISLTAAVFKSAAGKAAGTTEITVKLDAAKATDVRVGTPAALDPKAGEFSELAAVFQGLDIGSITAPKLDVATTGAGGQAAVAYAGVEFKSIRDGRIGAVSYTSADFKSEGTEPASGTLGSMAAADIDVVTMLGATNPKRIDKAIYTQIQGPVTVGPIRIKSAAGSDVTIDAITSDYMAIGPKFSVAKVQALMSSLPQGGRQLSPAETSALMTQIGSLYEDISIGLVELRGMRAIDPGTGRTKQKVDVGIGLLRLSGLTGGRLDEYVFEAIKFSTPALPTPVEVGRIALKGLAIGELLQTMSKLGANPGQPATPQLGSTVLGMVEGFEMRGVDIPDPRTKTTTRINDLKASWGNPVNGVPTQLKLEGAVDLPLDPTQTAHAALLQRGFKALPAVFDATAVWTQADKTLRLQPGKLELKGLGAISADVTLANVPVDEIGLDGAKFMSALPSFEIGKIALDIADLGAMSASPSERAAVAMQFAASREKLAATGTKADNFIALTHKIEEFTATPGKTISLRFAPVAPLTVGDLLVAINSEAALATLLDAATFEATVK